MCTYESFKNATTEVLLDINDEKFFVVNPTLELVYANGVLIIVTEICNRFLAHNGYKILLCILDQMLIQKKKIIEAESM